jgi:hypothetical protein
MILTYDRKWLNSFLPNIGPEYRTKSKHKWLLFSGFRLLMIFILITNSDFRFKILAPEIYV